MDMEDLKSSLLKVLSTTKDMKPIFMVVEFAKEIENSAINANLLSEAQAAVSIAENLSMAYDNAIKDLEAIAKRINEHNIVAGYIVVIILSKDDGTKVTVTRNIKPDHKEPVMEYLSGKEQLTQPELDNFDNFLKNLK